MPSRLASIVRLSATVACSLAAAAALQAELLKVSPFLTPQSASTPTANAPLEYVASTGYGGARQFRVVSNNPTRRTGAWLKVGERDSNLGIVLKQHVTDPDMVIVEQAGQTLTLPLRVSKVVSSGAPPVLVAPVQARTGVAMPTVAPNVISSVVANPTPADERVRLDAVAAEVARRRAIRDQAAQQAAQPGSQPAPTQPQPPIGTRQDLQQAQQAQGGRLNR